MLNKIADFLDDLLNKLEGTQGPKASVLPPGTLEVVKIFQAHDSKESLEDVLKNNGPLLFECFFRSKNASKSLPVQVAYDGITFDILLLGSSMVWTDDLLIRRAVEKVHKSIVFNLNHKGEGPNFPIRVKF